MLTRYHESKGENRIPQEEHKDVFRNRSGLSIMEAPLSSFLKTLISVVLQNRKEYQRQQEGGYLREEGKKAM